MKVYAAPENITLTADYSNYDREVERQKEEQYRADIKAWLVEQGYTGPHTGETGTFPVADGRAEYMFADAGRRSCLIHLEICDAYQYPDVQFLPKAEILRRIEQGKKLAAIFAKK